MWSLHTAFAFLLATTLLPLHAQRSIHLKTGDIQPTDERDSNRRTLKRLDATRWHGVARVGVTSGDAIRALRARGVGVLGYVPSGLFVSIPEGASLAGSGIEWVVPLKPEQKVSPLLHDRASGDARQDFLVEFHSDVAVGDAITVALRSGFLLKARSDLLPNHLLLSGAADRLPQLAEWDEAEYIFPAMSARAQATPLYGCGGGVTRTGSVPQSVALMGNGWDGPGLGTASLNYSFLNMTAKLPAASVQTEVARALAEWVKYVQVSFTPVTGDPVRTIAVEFVTGNHGDGYPFTSSSQLAHTFYPAPLNLEPIAGDMHFNDVESWHIGTDIDVFSLALHEAGHALGLGHSDNPNDVMYPYYRKVTGLSANDIGAIRSLYLARSTGTSSPFVLSVSPSPASTSSVSIDLSGTVFGGTGAVVVQWVTSAGSSGIANGSPAWVVSAMPLIVGANIITITATDGAGNRAVRSFVVTRIEAVPPRAPLKSPPPSLTIQSPGSTNVGTSAATIAVSGTASSIVGLTSVTWTSSLGSGQAMGLASWNTGPIALMTGTNTIVVRAIDVAGNTAWRSLMVTRQ